MVSSGRANPILLGCYVGEGLGERRVRYEVVVEVREEEKEWEKRGEGGKGETVCVGEEGKSGKTILG